MIDSPFSGLESPPPQQLKKSSTFNIDVANELTSNASPNLVSSASKNVPSYSNTEDEEEGDYEDDLTDQSNDNIESTPIDYSTYLQRPQSLSQSQLQRPLSHASSHSQLNTNKNFSKNDANSILGGESMNDIDHETPYHPIADENKTTNEQSKKVAGNAAPLYKDDTRNKSKFKDSQKVFSFSLPFGGFSNIRSNLFSQYKLFKLDGHLPNLPNLAFNNKDEEELEDIRLRLERQQSVSTIDEAKYFQNFKGTDDVRFRAVKHSLSSNINEMLPDFMHFDKKEKPSETIFNDIEGNIVVLGGYRGSILRDAKTRKRAWIPLKAGFHLRKINLLLGPNQEDELKATDLIYPDGMLTNIGPIDVCKKLIKKLDSNPKTYVKDYGYDWRLNLDLSSRKFEDYLQNIYDKTGKPTIVIAHSMGGLVTHLAMQRSPHLFRGIVYVGVPSECLNILGPIRFGDSVLFSDKILTYETNFMMRSSFCFLPLHGRVFVNKDTHECYDLDYFNPDTWVEYNLNPLVSKARKLQEASNSSSTSLLPAHSTSESSSPFPSINSISSKIKSYRSLSIKKSKSQAKNSPILSPTSGPSNELMPQTPAPDHNDVTPTKSPSPIFLNNRPSSPSHQEHDHFFISFTDAYNYLSEALKVAKEFILGLEYKPELATKYPPMAVVYGNKVPSVRGSNVRGIQDIKDGNYYEFFYGHGDGVVHQKWLMPEKKGFTLYNEETGEGEIVGKYSSDAGHVNLMTDFDAMGNALFSIVEAEKHWQVKRSKLQRRNERAGNSTSNLHKISEDELA